MYYNHTEDIYERRYIPYTEFTVLARFVAW